MSKQSFYFTYCFQQKFVTYLCFTFHFLQFLLLGRQEIQEFVHDEDSLGLMPKTSKLKLQNKN